MLLTIPTWFYPALFSAVITALSALIIVIWILGKWIFNRTIRVVDLNTCAITDLNITMIKMAGSFEKYQASNDGNLKMIQESARRAERQGIENIGEIATIKSDISRVEEHVGRIDQRVDDLTKDHDFYHKNKQH